MPKLPATYQPFDELQLCSNSLMKVKVPLLIDGNAVILVGRGPAPLVWLAAPTQPKGSAWDYVVRESIAGFRQIDVALSLTTREVTVRVHDSELLHVRALSDSVAVVDRVDLRPIGLAIYGDSSGLHAGPTRLASNVFNGIENALVFGKAPFTVERVPAMAMKVGVTPSDPSASAYVLKRGDVEVAEFATEAEAWREAKAREAAETFEDWFRRVGATRFQTRHQDALLEWVHAFGALRDHGLFARVAEVLADDGFATLPAPGDDVLQNNVKAYDRDHPRK